MKILKVEKGKVLVELTEEDIETIKSALGWAENETCDEKYAQMEDGFEKILSKIEKNEDKMRNEIA